MGSLFAGPHRGITAYTKESLGVGYTFYVAHLWGSNKLIRSTIVEVLSFDNETVHIKDRDGNQRHLSIETFIKVANNYTDLNGNPNPMIAKPRPKGWWKFWKKANKATEQGNG